METSMVDGSMNDEKAGQETGIFTASNYGNFDERWRYGQETGNYTASKLKKLRRSVFFANQCILEYN
jgi:hypothetical protein